MTTDLDGSSYLPAGKAAVLWRGLEDKKRPQEKRNIVYTTSATYVEHAGYLFPQCSLRLALLAQTVGLSVGAECRTEMQVREMRTCQCTETCARERGQHTPLKKSFYCK